MGKICFLQPVLKGEVEHFLYLIIFHHTMILIKEMFRCCIACPLCMCRLIFAADGSFGGDEGIQT
ncbi:hypothetical protein HMPREF9069_01343 [Atopobium sp. oral taxon 810 str. F0209]|nr:hypothetical protein HMPREF9069_01343 [Atopobium sp. oral taxon 810 str. F0209]